MIMSVLEKKRYIFTGIFITLIFFLYFRNLDGAICLFADEVRAFTMMPSGPLIYILCYPIRKLFYQVHYLYYFSSFLSIISIFIFYRICVKISDQKTAIISTIIFALFPCNVNYSRLLYPAVFINFFLLVTIDIMISSSRASGKKQLVYYSALGILIPILFYTHPASYAPLFGLTVTLIFVILYFYNNPSLDITKKLILPTAIVLISAIITFFTLELLIRWMNPDFIYHRKLLSFHKEVLAGIHNEGNKMFSFFYIFIKKIFSTLQSIYRALFIIVLLIIGLYKTVKYRMKLLSLPYIFIVSGVGIFLLMSSIGIHETQYRHFIWVTIPLSFSLGYTIYHIYISSKNTIKYFIIISFIIFVSSATIESYLVSEETFRLSSINLWLKENNIPKEKILTTTPFVIMFASLDNQHIPSSLPLKDQPHWFSLYPKKHTIIWELVYLMYKKGKAEYIIPSGIGSLAYIGEDDRWLEKVKPIKQWLHPYSLFKHRIFNEAFPYTQTYIKIYKLSDVFPKKNLLYVKNPYYELFNAKAWKQINLYNLSPKEKFILKTILLKNVVETSQIVNKPVITMEPKTITKYVKLVDEIYRRKENQPLPLIFAIKMAKLIDKGVSSKELNIFRNIIIKELKKDKIIR